MSDAYREQLRRIANAVTRDGCAEIVDALDATSTERLLRVFADGNVEKRLDKLTRHVEFLAEAIPDLAELAVAYVKRVPPAAYDSVVTDGERFLDWLVSGKPLSLEQRDYVSCQRARGEVEMHAAAHRLNYVRFQELLSVAESLAAQLDESNLTIRLNPTLAWTRFETTALLDEDSPLPADVAFFACQGEIASAEFELEGVQVIRELQRLEPVTLATWSAVSEHADRETLVDFCQDLATLGLVAFQ